MRGTNPAQTRVRPAPGAVQSPPSLSRRATILQLLLLAAVVIVCLAPFAGKAFSIDEPLFVWVARHIQSNPADPYGFEVNWSDRVEPMWKATKNPPLASYYTALAAYVVGWSETALHLAFLLPAIGVVLGTYLLARRLCMRPMEAALASVLTPVFLVSSTAVMCDVMMLAFWVWATFLWMRGIEEDNHAMLAVSAILIALSALTKYFGMSLVPLLLGYAIVRTRRFGWWAAYLLIPLAALAGYQWATHSLYGRGLLLDACTWSSSSRSQTGATAAPKLLTCLAFTGGGMVTALFLAPVLWSRRNLAVGVALFAVLFVLISSAQSIGGFAVQSDGFIRWLPVIQLSLMATVGISVLALAGLDFRSRRDAGSVMLCMWLAGTLVFAALLNWSVNGRSVLPIVPAVGILLMRRVEQGKQAKSRYVACALVLAAIFSLLVTWSDYRYANTARTAAREISERYGGEPRTIWFQGHWGFQYYMESLGGRAAGYGAPPPEINDVVVIPSNNCVAFPAPEGVPATQTIELRSGPLGIMDQGLGAGFYSDLWGPLPFAIGSVSPERYDIYLVN